MNGLLRNCRAPRRGLPRALVRARAKSPPAFVGDRCRSRVSDMFDSPERSEDYRDMFATPTREPEGRRSSGAAGRPRAAKSSIAAPRREAETCADRTAVADLSAQRKSSACRKGAPPVLSHSFCPPRLERWLTKWRRGVGRQARQKRGECVLYFKTLSPLGGYERDRAPVHTRSAAVPFF